MKVRKMPLVLVLKKWRTHCHQDQCLKIHLLIEE